MRASTKDGKDGPSACVVRATCAEHAFSMSTPNPATRHSSDLEFARRSVLVRKPLHWRVAAALISELEQAWRALDATAPAAASNTSPCDEERVDRPLPGDVRNPPG